MFHSIEKYKRKLKKRKILFLSLLGLVICYVAVLIYLGAGDSRTVAPDAISFGSWCVLIILVYLLIRIKKISALLRQNDYNTIKETMIREEDERNIWLYERSGGSVFLCSFIVTMMITITCSLFNNEAFFSSLITMASMLIIKVFFYLYNRHHYNSIDDMEE